MERNVKTQLEFFKLKTSPHTLVFQNVVSQSYPAPDRRNTLFKSASGAGHAASLPTTTVRTVPTGLAAARAQDTAPRKRVPGTLEALGVICQPAGTEAGGAAHSATGLNDRGLLPSREPRAGAQLSYPSYSAASPAGSPFCGRGGKKMRLTTRSFQSRGSGTQAP